MRSASIARWVAGVAALVAASGQTDAASKSWDHVANIKAAAAHLAQLQIAKGALGAYEFIDACYKTHELAEEFAAPLEGCIVQDWIHTRITAAVYAGLPPDQRAKMGSPSPEELESGMRRRVGYILTKFKVKQEDAEKLTRQIVEYGVPSYKAARFPGKQQ